MDGGVVDLSIGTPTDPPPAGVLEALGRADEGGAVRSYPSSIGSAALRHAIVGWTEARFAVELPVGAVAACIGTKEFVATVPQWLKLRSPELDTVLYPSVSYPTYAMGATLAGLRAVPVPVDEQWRLDLSAVSESDAARALLLWVNSPGNPAGGLDDLDAAAAWGRARGVPVFSDECYAEFTWDGPPRTVLETGVEGVIALHSLSKRSNLAGMRVGWYAGDPGIVEYLQEVRKHVGMMLPGPAQAAGVAALRDLDHVQVQRDRYRSRLIRMREILLALGVDAPLPGGGFYLWAPAPGGDAWGVGRSSGRGGRRAGLAGRPLRPGRGRSCPLRHGATVGPTGAGGVPARGLTTPASGPPVGRRREAAAPTPAAPTPAVAVLRAAGVAHRMLRYDHDPAAGSWGEEVAVGLGLDPSLVHKTLMAVVDDAWVVALVPVTRRLDLKALAATVRGRRAALADPADAERVTGYVVGGISPLGQRRRLPVVIDRGVLDHDLVYVSAGRRGLELEVGSADLIRLCGATTAGIAT